MANLDNLGIQLEKRKLLEHFQQGINQGTEADAHPVWVNEFYATHPPQERGYLLGVLLEEWERIEKEYE